MDKKFITGFIAGAITFSSIGVFAAGGKAIEVFYSIKDIKIDNVSQMPSQKPFTYNGTTFVPLRFIADKLKQPVKFDTKTQTIFIGQFDGEKVYLGDGIKHSDDDTTALSYEYSNGTKTVKDNLKKDHSKYLLLKYEPTMTQKPAGKFTFNLNKQYTKFFATMGFIQGSGEIDKPIQVRIYADDKRIFAGQMERGKLPSDINLNVTDVIKLRIETDLDSEKSAEIGLFDAYLEQVK
ncbi:stalk domain-containing protein [Schinkia sp. CFF1]